MTPQLLSETKAELTAAALFYNGEWKGLGKEFLDEVEPSLSTIAYSSNGTIKLIFTVSLAY
jgi:hypothetical protein